MPYRPDFGDIVGSHPTVYTMVVGSTFTDATQSSVMTGIVKSVQGDFSALTAPDSRGEPYTNAQPIKIKIVSDQDNYDAVKRVILLAQALLNTVFQFGNDYYNFVDPYSTSLTATLNVSESEISLEIDFDGMMFASEWATVLANTTALNSTGGGTGPYISGLTRQYYNDSEYGIPNFQTPAVYAGTGNTSTDDSVGLIDGGGTKFSMQITGKYKTTRMQTISRKVIFKNEIVALQNTVTPVTLFNSWANTEQVITWKFANGLTIVLDKCTKIGSGPIFDQDGGTVKMVNEGSTFLDPVNGTPTNVVFDDVNKKITFSKQGKIYS